MAVVVAVAESGMRRAGVSVDGVSLPGLEVVESSLAPLVLAICEFSNFAHGFEPNDALDSKVGLVATPQSAMSIHLGV